MTWFNMKDIVTVTILLIISIIMSNSNIDIISILYLKQVICIVYITSAFLASMMLQ